MGSSSTESSRVISALVVDDDRVTRLVHKRELNKLGVVSQEVENGKEAVDLCGSGEVFDLILMDYNMPIMNGLEATRLLREMNVTSRIVGVTAEKEEEIRGFMEAGLDEYQEKPLTRTKIVSILDKIKTSP